MTAPRTDGRSKTSARNGRNATRLATGGTGRRWMVPTLIPPDERPAVIRAARAADQTLGEWVTEAVRRALPGDGR